MINRPAHLGRLSLALSLGAALAGCATTRAPAPPSPPQAPLTVISKSALTADPVLRVVTRGDTASAAGLSAVAGVLGAFSGRQITTFNKEQLRGTAVESRPNPSGPLREALQAGLIEYAQAHPSLAPPERFELHHGTWLLVYEELGNGSTPYELRFDVSLRGEPAGLGSASFSPVVQTCRPAPFAHPLEDWQRDGYALVDTVAQRYVAQCAAEFAGAFPVAFGADRLSEMTEAVAAP